jgi:hypothetical protein
MYLQKRSLDPESKTKREKLDEQTPPASTLGKMWQK